MSTITLGRTGSSAGTGALGRTWSAIVAVVSTIHLAISRSHEVQRLLAMSDAQLARRGLRREGVVEHVMETMPD